MENDHLVRNSIEYVEVNPCLARGTFLGWHRHPHTHWECQKKYDGERRVAQFIDGKVYMTGRRRSTVTGDLVEKGMNVYHLRYADRSLDGMILDGEVYIPGGHSNDMTSIMGCKDPFVAKRKVDACLVRPQYAAFDVIALPGRKFVTHVMLADRMALLSAIDLSLWSKHAHMVDRVSFEQGYQYEIAHNGEGVVLKDLRSRYVYGVCGSWVKVKPVCTGTVKIVGFERGEPGKYRQTLGALRYEGVVDGYQVAGTCSGMDDATRHHIWQSKSRYLNRLFDIEYARVAFSRAGGLHTLYHARFSRWREDL